MKKIYLITMLFAFQTFQSCKPKSDCTHNFVYKGKIKSNEPNDSLSIRFNNLGNILFKINFYKLQEIAKVDSSGNYIVKGDFLTACESDKNLLSENDTLRFEIIKNQTVIKKGKYSFKDLALNYIDSTLTTEIILPNIKVE